MSKEPDLLDLEDRLTVLYDCYESLYLLCCGQSDVGADRVAPLLLSINDALGEILRGLERLRDLQRVRLVGG